MLNRLPSKYIYALPAFVLAFPTIPVFVLLPSFYAETVGLGLTTVGIVLFSLRVFDVITDPLIGSLTDEIPKKYGRRRLPMAIGGIVAGPALIFLFSPTDDVTAWYLVIWGGLLYLGWTIIQIPYLAWSVELSNDYEERNHINGLREGSGLAGIVAIGFALLFLSDTDPFTRYSLIAWITCIIGIILFALAFKYVPESHHIGIHPILRFPYKNKLFLRLLSAWFINGLANGLPSVCLPLYLTYILQVGEADKYLLIFAYFIFAILGIPIWIRLAQNRDKHFIWCMSMLLTCATFLLVPFLGAGHIFAFGLICAATGFTLGSDLSLPPSMEADCADWDRYRFGFERTTTLFSYWSMATKLALGLAVGIAFPLLDYAGVSGDPKALDDSAIFTLILIYALVPIVLKLIAIGLMWHFPLGHKQYEALKHALEKKR